MNRRQFSIRSLIVMTAIFAVVLFVTMVTYAKFSDRPIPRALPAPEFDGIEN